MSMQTNDLEPMVQSGAAIDPLGFPLEGRHALPERLRPRGRYLGSRQMLGMLSVMAENTCLV